MKSRRGFQSRLAQVAVAAVVAWGISSATAFAADQAMIDAAKKEGALVYATNLFAPTTQKELQKAFRDHYKLPDSFKMQGYIGTSSSVVSRTTEELQANKVTVDWLAVNFATFWRNLQKRGELMKYCSPEYKGLTYIKKAGVLDGGCEFQSVAAIVFGLLWNPQFVKEDLQSWNSADRPQIQGPDYLRRRAQVGRLSRRLLRPAQEQCVDRRVAAEDQGAEAVLRAALDRYPRPRDVG